MILRMPLYCTNFRCTADKCTDNCCIGWEIDIDDNSLDYYKGVKGSFGDKLRNNIAGEDPACFVLGENERCPFLNNQNLCEIYINLGEDKLCGICTEHPRYYEWFDGIKEGGTGLGCEESARIILSEDRRFSWTETEIPDETCDDYDEELYVCLEQSRKNIIDYLQNRELSFEQRVSDILGYAEELQYHTDNGDYDVFDIISDPDVRRADIRKIISLFSALEMLDENRGQYLKECADIFDETENKKDDFKAACPDSERYLENIAVYFIWRHFMKGVFDGEFYSKVFLMAAGCALIKYLAECHFASRGNIEEADYVCIAKDFSKETEYSETNLNTVMDAAYNDQYFA